MNSIQSRNKKGSKAIRWCSFFLLFPIITAPIGCRTKAKAKDQGFFTSGSRDADQRASQRMAKAEQLSGSGEGTGEKGAKKAVKASQGPANSGPGTNRAASVEGKLSLYDRLGGTDGIKKIVDDFTPRILQDPRVNWQRGSTKHGVFSRGGSSQTWTNNAQNVALLKTHIIEFMALATGGPAKYTGKSMKDAHNGMHITNPEFDAAIGDVKASLDNLQIPNKEQKELLAIIESTRPEIVTVR